MNTTDYRITKTCSEYIKQHNLEWLMSYAIMKNKEDKELAEYKFQRWFSYTVNGENIIRVVDELDLLIKEYRINIHLNKEMADIVLYGNTFMMYWEFCGLRD